MSKQSHNRRRLCHKSRRPALNSLLSCGFALAFALTLALAFSGLSAYAQAQKDQDITKKDIIKKLQGFDAYMEQTIKDWNTPGIGVGIVVNDKLVFAKGYGYRDYEKKLPFTPTTLCPVASNTKLFTAGSPGVRFAKEEINRARANS